jgi:TolB-like protein/DNA-binding winged helix-turn-helix (wHTH) protein/Tfp pilus assembly protein PilF
LPFGKLSPPVLHGGLDDAMGPMPSSYLFGPFRLDPARRALEQGGSPVSLSARAFDVLLALIEGRDRVLSRAELMALVWPGMVVEDHNLSVQISALRRALGDTADEPAWIATVPGRGYRFVGRLAGEQDAAVAPVVPVSAEAAAPRAPWRAWAPIGATVLALVLAAAGAVLWQFLPGTARAPAPLTAPFVPPQHSVAVLAFANMSGDPGQEYFSDGLSEELIDSLGRIATLRVAARLSAFSFKGKPATIADIARALNVGAVLEGSVRRDAARLRITAQLVDAASGFQLWSQSYDRDSADIFKVQADIAASVTAALRVRLLGEDASRLSVGGTDNPAAFDAYLRGMKGLNDGGANGYSAAVAAFDQAIALDPRYALAHLRRAHAVRDLAGSQDKPPPGWSEMMEQSAVASAARAIALAPELGIAHAEYGATLEESQFDFPRALAEMTRARALAPGDAQTNMAYAELQIHLNHVQEAVAAARLAATLDPLTPQTYRHLAAVLTLARRHDDAMAALRHGMQLEPAPTDEDLDLQGEIQLHQGRIKEALRTCLPDHDWEQELCLAMAYYGLGDHAAAAASMERLRADLGDNGAMQYVDVYSYWGHTDDALQWLETAYRLRDPGLIEMKVVPSMDSIRGTARYREIERRLAFPK